MKRLSFILLVLLLLFGIGIVAWTAAGLPPVRMVWRYGFSSGPGPTGRSLIVEGVEFVEIGPGCFLMGSEKNAEGGDFLGRWCARFGLPWGDQPKPSNEMPVHWVEFPRGYWIARTEVTNEQHDVFDPGRPRYGTFMASIVSLEDLGPVVHVNWGEATWFCEWLSEQSGLPIRLPSESEWECACRAGSDREYCFGDDEGRLGEYAWFGGGWTSHLLEVGSRRANAWGFHGFHGNAAEWCADTYQKSYEGAPADGTAWTVESWRFRVIRGGSILRDARGCRSAVRSWQAPARPDWELGFRPAFSREAE